MIDAITGPMRAPVVDPDAAVGLAPARPASPASAAEAASDFGAFLAQMAASAASTLRAGEATALLAVGGQASTQQVVEAVMSAEQTLQSAIAIRDKVVSAFLEVSRMSI